MWKSRRKWKQLKIKSRFYSHIYNKLRNFATVIPLSLRELVFYSTNLSLPIFLFTREVAVLYSLIYQDIIIHRKPCLLNICPYFAISLFCIGEELSLPWGGDFHASGLENPSLSMKRKWRFLSVFDRIFLSLHPKYFSCEETVQIIAGQG